MFLTLFAAAAVAAAPTPPAPAAAAQATPPATPAGAALTPEQIKAAQAEAAAKFNCSYEEVTGSRFPKKVCRRKDEAAMKQSDDQQRLLQMQRSTGGTHY